MNKQKMKFLIVLMIAVSFCAAFLFPGIGDNPQVQNYVTFIGILFGLIVGFFIADLYARYQAIRQNAAADSSCLSTFYFMSQILDKDIEDKVWLKRVENRIENYVKKFMPLPWEQYSETEAEFIELGKSLIELNYKGEKPNQTYMNILLVYGQHSTARENLVMFGKDKLSFGEWLTVGFLGLMLLGSLFYIKDTSLISSILTGAITSAILILFVVLHDLNNFDFGENAISIEPYERVLDAIGKPRYFGSHSQKDSIL